MDALLLVDIQNDFLPDGALAVKEGDQIIPVVNELQPYFELVVATQDFHPADHGSFAANHSGKKPGEYIILEGLEQILWPVHCVQGTAGAEFAKTLKMNQVATVVKKGLDKNIDSYSGFYDNGHKRSTGLTRYLKDKGVHRVFVTGLAADYCVKFTALDALKEGFKTVVVQDATRAVNLEEGDFEKAMDELREKGAKVMQSKEVVKMKS
ncbi:bifunctional nicotinamidase/pyrazinamidase [Catalinimonas niigatensis]|uniref:bifunctional nicotinamidase/pyrazinamidase n=1 Tax=Catalinimonas niigatensis TaxID=1397264 RepID=UPI0026653765|nr:bifunctional nicotinamidase/pyrazinamidase [Catalinimonas niigatensis]WPP53214.1 bifunctional nicotinamidase/pyrazinamidase [Catalinimonas niigatensis]